MPNPVPYDEHACAQRAPGFCAEGAPVAGSPWAALLPVTQGMGHWLAIALVGSAVLRLWRSRGPGRSPALTVVRGRLGRLRQKLRGRLRG
jgi:hypothetical protein